MKSNKTLTMTVSGKKKYTCNTPKKSWFHKKLISGV